MTDCAARTWQASDLLLVNGGPIADIGLLEDQDNLLAIVKAGEIYKLQI